MTLALAVLSACGGGECDGERLPIVVASIDFTESEILAEIYALGLEGDGYLVERRLRLGERMTTVKPALETGAVDLVPEYLGTALEVGFGVEPSTDVDDTLEELRDAFERVGVVVLEPAPAEDKNGFAVTAETADRLNVFKLSDLADYASTLVFGGPPECPDRPRCLPGLQRVYGLQFARFVPLDAGGQLTAAALESGQIDVALLFTTDGTIQAEGWVLLEGDRGLQPVDNVVPVIRREILESWGDDVGELLNAISAKLTTEVLTGLNKRGGLRRGNASGGGP